MNEAEEEEQKEEEWVSEWKSAVLPCRLFMLLLLMIIITAEDYLSEDGEHTRWSVN